MADPVKILASEVVVNATPSNISTASLVRVINTDNSNPAKITLRDSSNNIIGTTTISFAGGDNSLIFIMKEPTDTIESNSTSNAVLGTSVGFY